MTPCLGDCLAEGAAALAAAGVPNARSEARLLLEWSLHLRRGESIGYPERPVNDRRAFDEAIVRRKAREPVSRILGEREFWSLPFFVAPETLDPRPDSESVVEAALAAIPERGVPLRILDLGTGTGCLLLSLLQELPCAFGVGVDRCARAAAVAIRNATRLRMRARCRFLVGDWAESLDGPFDLIVSNPPYIPTGSIDGLAPEVARYEPRLALDGGGDGLDGYRRLAPELKRLLRRRGFAVVEVGAGQLPDVSAVFRGSSLRLDRIGCDLSGHARAGVFRMADAASDGK